MAKRTTKVSATAEQLALARKIQNALKDPAKQTTYKLSTPGLMTVKFGNGSYRKKTVSNDVEFVFDSIYFGASGNPIVVFEPFEVDDSEDPIKQMEIPLTELFVTFRGLATEIAFICLEDQMKEYGIERDGDIRVGFRMSPNDEASASAKAIIVDTINDRLIDGETAAIFKEAVEFGKVAGEREAQRKAAEKERLEEEKRQKRMAKMFENEEFGTW